MNSYKCRRMFQVDMLLYFYFLNDSCGFIIYFICELKVVPDNIGQNISHKLEQREVGSCGLHPEVPTEAVRTHALNVSARSLPGDTAVLLGTGENIHEVQLNAVHSGILLVAVSKLVEYQDI